MNYWIIKTEPNKWSWHDQKRSRITMWDGVRNYQARNNLIAMKKKDYCFFYHSVNEKQIVGIVSVIKEHYPDPTDKTGKFVVVDIKVERSLPKPVSLKEIKDENKLSHIALVKQSRLSVMPIDFPSWKLICKMGKLKK